MPKLSSTISIILTISLSIKMYELEANLLNIIVSAFTYVIFLFFVILLNHATSNPVNNKKK